MGVGGHDSASGVNLRHSHFARLRECPSTVSDVAGDEVFLDSTSLIEVLERPSKAMLRMAVDR